MPENNDVRSVYPPMPTTDPMVTNVNMRAMPGHEEWATSGPSYANEGGTDVPMNTNLTPDTEPVDHPEITSEGDAGGAPAVDPTEHPEVEKTPAVRSLSRPTDVKAEPDGEQLKLSAEVASDEDTKKLVFHVDGKQAAVVDTTGGHVEVTVPASPGDHEVRAFAFTGEKSGPWSESVSVTV